MDEGRGISLEEGVSMRVDEFEYYRAWSGFPFIVIPGGAVE